MAFGHDRHKLGDPEGKGRQGRCRSEGTGDEGKNGTSGTSEKTQRGEVSLDKISYNHSVSSLFYLFFIHLLQILCVRIVARDKFVQTPCPGVVHDWLEWCQVATDP